MDSLELGLPRFSGAQVVLVESDAPSAAISMCVTRRRSKYGRSSSDSEIRDEAHRTRVHCREGSDELRELVGPALDVGHALVEGNGAGERLGAGCLRGKYRDEAVGGVGDDTSVLCSP
jgi:hypothetical protein